MIAVAGSDKADDVLVTVDLSYEDNILVDLKSKNKALFGKQIENVVREVAEEMNVKNASFKLEDFGALDFVIRARVKTAIKRARGDK
ncbi:citrate lyase acyl carrier protein [Clostridium sp.]|uniref:citrate lyase acyl carrier protein n=1 Tax=Clostridium sp. TaxID=1506 RepID=UPI003464E373